MPPPSPHLAEPLLEQTPDRERRGQASPSNGGAAANGAAAGGNNSATTAALARPGPTPGKYANPLLSVCPFILVNELCERLAYNG